MRRLWLNTIDLDYNEERRVGEILDKIVECSDLYSLRTEISSSTNGVHLILYCCRDCDLCRLVFDDPVRYAKDLQRPVYSRNVLFESKLRVKRGKDLYITKIS